MSDWQHRELARFDADGDDMRIVADPWTTPRCVHCGREIDHGVECDKCLKLNEEEIE